VTAPHKPRAAKAARSHATISRIGSLEEAQAQLREQAALIKDLKRKTRDQASTIDQLREEKVELRREPAKLQAMLGQIFETYEWQVRARGALLLRAAIFYCT
jgi:tRNA A37 threonylcarbamoyladenosine synthetase subunit TsaC/SUA5/YrdC